MPKPTHSLMPGVTLNALIVGRRVRKSTEKSHQLFGVIQHSTVTILTELCKFNLTCLSSSKGMWVSMERRGEVYASLC